ncbi:MAG: hypothetical protein EHM14_05670 [Methanothrix sp.]|nr:MAG: hypothetical protein EHM14_05670 [Methanothrix sp.]
MLADGMYCSIHDASWSKFIFMLFPWTFRPVELQTTVSCTYKAQSAGRELTKVDPSTARLD